jgi:hypothetical protein
MIYLNSNCLCRVHKGHAVELKTGDETKLISMWVHAERVKVFWVLISLFFLTSKLQIQK